MAASTFDPPPPVRPGEPPRASWANRVVASLKFLWDSIQKRTPRDSPDIAVKWSAGGYTLMLKRRGTSGTSGTPCPFGELIVTDSGAYNLRGGQVIGGEGNIIVEDTEVRAAPSEGGPADTSAEKVWLHIEATALVVDEVLMPGCDLTIATIAHGSAPPADVMPSVATPLGKRNILLGEFLEGGGFRPAGCGNFQIGHCIGEGLKYVRG